MAAKLRRSRPLAGGCVLALGAAGCKINPSAVTLQDAEPSGDSGQDAGRAADPTMDAATAHDASVLLDAGHASLACQYPNGVADASCAPSGLTCDRKFMCYTATAVGPVGIDRCECVNEHWSCTDGCGAWQAHLTADASTLK